MTLTELEFDVLQMVGSGVDPWRGRASGTRTVSQALQRLKRKGAIVNAFERGQAYRVTEAGRTALTTAR